MKDLGEVSVSYKIHQILTKKYFYFVKYLLISSGLIFIIQSVL